MPDELDKIRERIARLKGYKLTASGWELDAGMGVTLDLFDHPVPASLDWVAEQWPSNYYLAVRTAPGIEGWEASAMPHDEFEFHVVRTAPTELHARLALLLAVLEAEGTR